MLNNRGSLNAMHLSYGTCLASLNLRATGLVRLPTTNTNFRRTSLLWNGLHFQRVMKRTRNRHVTLGLSNSCRVRFNSTRSTRQEHVVTECLQTGQTLPPSATYMRRPVRHNRRPIKNRQNLVVDVPQHLLPLPHRQLIETLGQGL